jgi:hypothetical protein
MLALPWRVSGANNIPTPRGYSTRAWHRAGFTGSGLGARRRSFSPSADFCPPIERPLGPPSPRQMDRAPRGRRVTFLPSPPPIPHRVPDDIGLWTPTLPRPHCTASHAIRVPRVRRLPSASFRSHLAVGTLAGRLGVSVIKASQGLAPSRHFLGGFRLPVDSAVMALCAMPGAQRDREAPHGFPPPTPPGIRVVPWRFNVVTCVDEHGGG